MAAADLDARALAYASHTLVSVLLALGPASAAPPLRLGESRPPRQLRIQQPRPPPQLASARQDLGLPPAAGGRDAEAEAAFRAALAVRPVLTASSMRMAERLLARGNATEAAAIMRTAVAHAPEDARAAELYARALLAQPPRPETAVEALRWARRGLARPHAHEARALVTWAEALAASGAPQRARAALALARQAPGARQPALAREIAEVAARLAP